MPHLVGSHIETGRAEGLDQRPVKTLCPKRPPSRTVWPFPPAERTCRTGWSRRVSSASTAASGDGSRFTAVTVRSASPP